MQVSEKTLTFDRTLWVQYGGVDVQDTGARIAISGRDDDSFLKVLNHFGRVLKLYTFEGGHWMDADTGGPAQPFDDSQAGRLPTGAASPPAAPATTPVTGRKAAPKPAGQGPRKTAAPKVKTKAKAGAASRGGAKATSKTGRPSPLKTRSKSTGKPTRKSAGKKVARTGSGRRAG